MTTVPRPLHGRRRRCRRRLLHDSPRLHSHLQDSAGGWNRIHLIVDDLAAEVDRLSAAGVRFRNDIVTGPGGSQILLDDPSGNPMELFQPRRQ